MNWTEVERRPWDADVNWANVPCRGCGKTITLFFNGGELDSNECCGYRYELEHTQIDLVISREDEAGRAPDAGTS